MRSQFALVAAVCFAAGCGGGIEDDASPPDAAIGDAVAALDSSRPVDAVVEPDAMPPPADAPPAAGCSEAIYALASALYAYSDACTAVVRLDYQSRTILGYQLVCGRYRGVTTADAEATAAMDTGFGATGIMVLSPDPPEDEFVFYQPPGDFGGVAAVSADTGLSVFGGGIVWNGAGDITYPNVWHPAGELGKACDGAGGIPSGRGYDLVRGLTLGSADIEAALDVVRQTAVPAAMWEAGYVFDAVVLAYPRTVGAFDPATAEWIVLVNGGWLD